MRLPQEVENEIRAAHEELALAEIGPALVDEALRIADGDSRRAAQLIIQRLLRSDHDLARRLLEIQMATAAVRADLVEVLA